MAWTSTLVAMWLYQIFAVFSYALAIGLSRSICKYFWGSVKTILTIITSGHLWTRWQRRHTWNNAATCSVTFRFPEWTGSGCYQGQHHESDRRSYSAICATRISYLYEVIDWISPNWLNKPQELTDTEKIYLQICRWCSVAGSRQRTAYRRGRSAATGPVTPVWRRQARNVTSLRNCASTNFY